MALPIELFVTDAAGNPINGAKVYHYEAGTFSPKAVYTTSALDVAHPQGFALANGRGRYFLGGGSYRRRVTDASDADLPQYAVDNISDVSLASDGSTTFANPETQTATAGQTVFDLLTTSFTPGTNGVTVEMDGDVLTPADFTEATSTRVVLTEACSGGEELVFRTGRRLTDGVSAEQVGWTSPLAGGVARSQANVNADRASSRDVGISSSKSASYNRGALQALLTSSGASRIEILTDPGEIILVDGPIDIPANVDIVGLNRWGSHIRSTSANSAIFRFGSGNSFSSLEHLRLDYQGTPVSGANAIEINGSLFVELRSIVVDSAFTAIFASGGGNHQFSNIWLFNYEQCGVLARNVIDINLSRFRFDAANSTRGTLGGIRLEGGVEAFTASQGDITRGLYGITTAELGSTARGSAPYFNRFSKVLFDSAKEQPAYLRGLAHTDFVGCWFASGGYDSTIGYATLADKAGIDMADCTHVRFAGGDSYANGGRGALVAASNKHITFGGMGFKRNYLSRSGDGPAIEFLAGTTDFSVQGCTFERDANTTTYRQRTAVQVATGASDRYVIQGNKCGACNLVDNGSGSDKVVADNVGIA